MHKFSLPGVLAFLIGAFFIGNLFPVSAAFLETFNGAPSVPTDFKQVDQPNWDIQIHSRDDSTWQSLEPMEAQHGPNCEAPIDPTNTNLVYHHLSGTYEDYVFNCKDHMMTAIKAGGYGLIVLTPNQMVDFTNGEGVISWDMSTMRTSTRDWWDVRVTPYDENLTLPAGTSVPDLGGPAQDELNIEAAGREFDNGQGIGADITKNFVSTNEFDPYKDINGGSIESIVGKASPKTRTKFELHITKTHVKFGIPAGQLNVLGQAIPEHWFIDKNIQPLTWTRGVFQIAHHSYNPEKDNPSDCYLGNCAANTWHWDNVAINPSVPFTMIKADKRFVDDGSTLTFKQPAPANSNLRFSAIDDGNVEVSFNGGPFQLARIQPSQRRRSWSDGATGQFINFWTPVPVGTQRVNFRFCTCRHAAKDFAIWSTTAPTGGANLPAAIISLSPIASVKPTSAPTSGPSAIPTPVVSPLASPTVTPGNDSLDLDTKIAKKIGNRNWLHVLPRWIKIIIWKWLSIQK